MFVYKNNYLICEYNNIAIFSSLILTLNTACFYFSKFNLTITLHILIYYSRSSLSCLEKKFITRLIILFYYQVLLLVYYFVFVLYFCNTRGTKYIFDMGAYKMPILLAPMSKKHLYLLYCNIVFCSIVFSGI